MSKIVFIGSNPSQRSSSIVPFWRDARSTKTLTKWIEMAGQQVDIHIESLHYLNVANYVTPGNRPLTMKEIKAEISNLNDKVVGWSGINPDKIIALGKTAEIACTLAGLEFLAMPHPSGLNRQLNDPKFVAEKITALGEYLRAVKTD